MDVAVLGAAGGAGQPITAELAARGHQVVAVTRGGATPVTAGVTPAGADLYDLVSTRAACAGVEVVVLAASPPYHAWAGNFDRMLDTVLGAVLGAVAAVGARLVFVDNPNMYGPADGPISEGSPEQATGKGELRRDLARRILADVTRRFATLVERTEADGRAWILPAAPPLTQGQVTDHDTALRQTLAWQQRTTAGTEPR